MKRKYGWIPDLPDKRDFPFMLLGVAAKPLPPAVSLRLQCPAVYDQGQLGSCTANAIGAAFQFEQMRQKIQDFIPSRLFIYWNERDVEGTTDYDSGAMIRDGMRCIQRLGVCPETEWPYDISRFKDKPDAPCYVDAEKNQCLKYLRVRQTEYEIRLCISLGFPVVFGATLYESFESDDVAASGDVPMPKDSASAIGGHAMLIVGYDDMKQRFIFRNSWGAGWGDRGYGTFPYLYLTDSDLASDFWTVRLVEDGK